MSEATRHVIGMMTGTSIDGIDAAWMSMTGRGLELRAKLVAHISRPIGETLARELRRAADQEKMSAGEFAKLALKFGERHAEVAAELVEEGTKGGSIPQPDLICVHGQTVFHAPPVSWQLINVSPIVQRLHCPVVFDLRQADLAAGGQGAPITPMADWILFRSEQKSRAIVNLGGFCNVTVLRSDGATPPELRRSDEELPKRAAASSQRSMPDLEHVRGFDVCACNQILDAVAREAMGVSFDEDGRIALKGNVNAAAAEKLRGALLLQSKGGRSLGTGDDALQWVQSHLKQLSPNDLAATAVWAVANVIAEAIEIQRVDEIYLAGGGARHQLLVQLLKQRCTATVQMIDALGIPIESRESAAMAVLGALCADGIPITMPQVTGCTSPAPVAGIWALPQRQINTENTESTKKDRASFV